jgi:hypothetical protein
MDNDFDLPSDDDTGDENQDAHEEYEFIFDTEDPEVLKRVAKALKCVCEEFYPDAESDARVRWDKIKVTTPACASFSLLLTHKVRVALKDINPYSAKGWTEDDPHPEEARALEIFLNSYFRNPMFVYEPMEANVEEGQTFIVMNNDRLRLAPQDALAALNTLACLMNEERITIKPR